MPETEIFSLNVVGQFRYPHTATQLYIRSYLHVHQTFFKLRVEAFACRVSSVLIFCHTDP
jgi:hypothetical protein